jgi:hypothetical protein
MSKNVAQRAIGIPKVTATPDAQPKRKINWKISRVEGYVGKTQLGG